MVKSKNKYLNRDLNHYAHYTFKERLKYKTSCTKNTNQNSLWEQRPRSPIGNPQTTSRITKPSSRTNFKRRPRNRGVRAS